MKTNHLFPHRFKWIGWCLFVPFALLFFVAPIFSETFDDNLISFPTLSIGVKALNGFRLEGNEMGFTAAFERQDMFHEICIIAMSVALLFIAFAREKDEDEYVEHLRLHSFVWAIKANTILLILGTWLFFGGLYLWFILFWLISLFLIYIAKFQWELHLFRKGADDEK